MSLIVDVSIKPSRNPQKQFRGRLHEITTNLNNVAALKYHSCECLQPVHAKTVSPYCDLGPWKNDAGMHQKYAFLYGGKSR